MATRDLGHGVSIEPFGEGGWRVSSHPLALPWAPRAGEHPGSTVMWRGEPYEAVTFENSATAEVWILQPWPDPEVMRSVFRLDKKWVATQAATADDLRRQRVIYLLALPLAPVLACAPARLQRRWQSRWGFPAIAATFVSAVLEIVVGGVGVVQLLALTLGSGWFLEEPFRWAVVLAPALAVEALVRLATAAAHEPMGSFLGLPCAVLSPAAPMPRSSSRPTIDIEIHESGVLVVVSDVIRRDWASDGVLQYRGQPYRLIDLEKAGPRWQYRFERIDGEAEGPPLRLSEPAREIETAEAVRPPSVIRTTFVTAVVCMAPRTYQERWARHLGVRQLWFTLLGAGVELVGGWINLARGADGGGSLSLAVNLFFLVEAVTRLALLVATGRPVGSVFGWLVQPLLARMMPDEGDEGARRAISSKQ